MKLKPLETFESVGKTENRARSFFKKFCAKNGRSRIKSRTRFFAQDVRAIKSIESQAKDIAARGANIPSMTSLDGGLISCESLTKSGFGSSSFSRSKSLPEKLLNKQDSVTLRYSRPSAF